MGFELLMRAESEIEPLLDDPREGDETEVGEKGDEGGQTKRTHAILHVRDRRDGDETETTPEGPADSLSLSDPNACDPREGDDTETTQRDGGSNQQSSIFAEDPRDGDDTVPIRESPLSPPVRV